MMYGVSDKLHGGSIKLHGVSVEPHGETVKLHGETVMLYGVFNTAYGVPDKLNGDAVRLYVARVRSYNKKRKGNSEVSLSPFLPFTLSSYCGTGGCAPGGIIQTSTVVFGRLPHLVITICLGSTPRVFTK